MNNVNNLIVKLGEATSKKATRRNLFNIAQKDLYKYVNGELFEYFTVSTFELSKTLLSACSSKVHKVIILI